jgi:signal transduction histidine kinase/CheY-like chemotaxis protein
MPVGILGFSFNKAPQIDADNTFILTLADLYAQALDRARLFECEKMARREAELANKAKTDFLANMSHEIRTPIGVIQGYADLLLESEGLALEDHQMISIIQKNTQQLMGIIGEILDIAKIEAKKIEVERISFSLIDLVQDVETLATFKAKQKDVSIRFDYVDLPETICSDPTRLRQILVNLIGNAIKFTNRGYVQAKFEVLQSEDLNQSALLQVTVIDSGIGIAPDHHLRIFEPFIQADTSTRRRFGGTGLGLPISKRLAQALGGDLKLIRSSLENGSTFVLTIDCGKIGLSNRVVVTTKSSQAKGSHDRCLVGKRILLVEDSIDNQQLVSRFLAKEGVVVEVADSGITGVQMALAHDYQFILMDIQMPGLDGYEAVALLRARGYNRPIAAFTAHAMKSERERALASGFDDYLTKPIDRTELIQTVRRHVVVAS